jgi:hypothetical protein
MYGKLFSDRASVPELDRFLEQTVDRVQAELADDLAAAFGFPRPASGAGARADPARARLLDLAPPVPRGPRRPSRR